MFIVLRKYIGNLGLIGLIGWWNELLYAETVGGNQLSKTSIPRFEECSWSDPYAHQGTCTTHPARCPILIMIHPQTIVATFVDKPSPSKDGPSKLRTSRNSNNQEVFEISDDSTTEPESDDEIQLIETALGWAYVGSHNFTPSAWGTLSGSAFNPVMNVSRLYFFFFPRGPNGVACRFVITSWASFSRSNPRQTLSASRVGRDLRRSIMARNHGQVIVRRCSLFCTHS